MTTGNDLTEFRAEIEQQLDPGRIKRRSGRPPKVRPEGYDPLRFARGQERTRYAALAEKAHREPMAAIKVKCLDCCGWEYTEAKRCEIKSCALFPFNVRIFGRDAHDGADEPEGSA